MKRISCLLLLVGSYFIAAAQPGKQIIIETKNSSLVLSVDNNSRVTQSYLGKKLPATEYGLFKGGREVYLTAGMENQNEAAIRMIHSDGNPSLELKYVSDITTKKDANVSTVDISLKDPVYPVEVIIHYTTYYNEDVIKSWTEIRQQEKKACAADTICFINASS